MTTSTVTQYAVARGEKIIGDLYDTIDAAKQQLAWVNAQMTSVDLDPDVRLVVLETKTTVSRPHVYREPDDEPAAADDTADPPADPPS